ncbi:MAG: glycosyltransferase family 4 protein [Pelolinea sp.]|nr:glycosyltransferase family 4 protein [Pelolinea sp.]
MAHDYYQQPGGEDISFQAESDLLESNGQEVLRFTRDNDEISDYSKLQKIKLAFNTIWSTPSFNQVEAILQKERPDIVHFQNIFPLISPSALYACQKYSIPVILSIRNYRLMCVNGLFLRDDRICEDCLGMTPPLPGIIHACYRKSHLQSAVVATMLTFYRSIQTWNKKIDSFITPSEFTRTMLIRGGVSEKKIKVKPNFIQDLGEREEIEDYVVFVGRLSPEKGVIPLLKAILKVPKIKLVIVGDGPLRKNVILASDGHSNITYLGHLGQAQSMKVLKSARFLVYPTICYETFGRSIIEAYACGVPVIASRIGAVTELVRDGKTGFLVNPGDDDDLSEKIKNLWDNPDLCKQIGKNARQEYLNRYTPETNYPLLMKIYDSALKN